jgi:hypothetical protein
VISVSTAESRLDVRYCSVEFQCWPKTVSVGALMSQYLRTLVCSVRRLIALAMAQVDQCEVAAMSNRFCLAANLSQDSLTEGFQERTSMTA